MFQREPTLYSCLNVKELLAGKRRSIWSLSGRDSNLRPHSSWTNTQLFRQIGQMIELYCECLTVRILLPVLIMSRTRFRVKSRCIHFASDIAPLSNKGFLENQATIGCSFTLKRVGGMIRTCSHAEHAEHVSLNLRYLLIEGFLCTMMTFEGGNGLLFQYSGIIFT